MGALAGKYNTRPHIYMNETRLKFMTFDLNDSEITNSKWSHKTHKILLGTDSLTTSRYELIPPVF